MKNVWFLLVFALFLACGNDPAAPASTNANALTATAATQTLKGEFYADATGQYFINSVSGEIYRVQNKTKDLDTLYRRECGMAPVSGEAVCAVLSGSVAAAPEGGAETVFTVQKVDSMTTRNRFNACSAFAFWASGTEPFWGLEISTLRKALFFKNIGLEKGENYVLAKMQQVDKTWTYTANDASGKATVKAIIKQEPCNDGMSDMQFNYSCTLHIGTETYKGCAVKWGEKVKGE